MNISDKARKVIERGDPLGLTVSVSGVEESFTLSENDITLGGMSIERMTASGDRISLGAAYSSEMKMSIYNESGKYSGFLFEGAEMYVKVVVRLDDGTAEYIPMGYFTVDSQPRNLSVISLTALDRMARFDRPYDSKLSYPATLYNILDDACVKCSVPLGTSLTELMNGDYLVEKRPEGDDITYHQIIIWIAELTGSCAYIDHDGHLRFSWYKPSSNKLTPDNYYNFTIGESNINITGVRITANDENGTAFLFGTEDYAFNISGNLLAQGDLQSITEALGSKLVGFSYRPYKCSARELPHFWPLEGLTLTDTDGNIHETIISNFTYSFNASSALSAKGETAKLSGYASSAPMTKQERAILERIKAQTDRKLTSGETALLDLNALQANSDGYYLTRIPQPDGSVKAYKHDKPLLEESGFIATFTSGGYAYTTEGWNNGNPIWKYGHTPEGNAVMNTVYANKLTADLIVSGRLQSTDGESFFDLDNGYSQLKGSMKIAQDGYDGYMNLRADEIANYFEGKKTFFLNKDETEIEKLISRKQIDMEPIKIIPIKTPDRKGWAFVKLGGD